MIFASFRLGFSGTPRTVSGSVAFEGRKCFAFGPFCGKSSLLDVFLDRFEPLLPSISGSEMTITCSGTCSRRR